MPHAVSAERNYDEFIVERPMVGYGMEPPSVVWPGDSKVAVSFVLEITEGAELSLEHEDATSDNLFADLGTYPTREARDDMLESEFDHDISATVNVVTTALARAPYYAKRLAADKRYELSCGSSRWIDYFYMDPKEEEEEHIFKAIDYMEKLTGEVPKGWYIDRRSNTSQRLYTRAAKERGASEIYSSDSFSDDLPYWVTSPLAAEGHEDTGLLIVPSDHSCSDWRFNATAVGWGSGKDWLRHLQDTFDTLYEEGEEGQAKMMTITLHPRICGRAGRTAFLDEFIKYIKARDGVWIAKREEIADFWRKSFPYDPATAHGKLPIA
ncbi:hypothetical protein JCM8097_009132 [Rhodosporidiobolus ruineniae]